MAAKWMQGAQEELLLLSDKDREEYMASAMQLLWAHVQMRKPEKELFRVAIKVDPDGNFDLLATHEL